MPTTKDANFKEKESIQNKNTCDKCNCCINLCTKEEKEEDFNDSTNIKEKKYFSKSVLYYLSLVIMIYVLITVGYYTLDYVLNSDTVLEKFLNK